MKTQKLNLAERCAICTGKVLVAAIGVTCFGMVIFEFYTLISQLL